MATPEEALVTALTTDADLSGLVGSRVYPLTLPDGVSFAEGTSDLPALAYQVITNRREFIDLQFCLFQVTVFAKTYGVCREVADRVCRAVHGYQSADIKAAAYVTDRDFYNAEVGVATAPVEVRIASIRTEGGD